MLFRQFSVNLNHKIGKCIYNGDYNSLLKHLLVSVKAFHYFRSMRSCFRNYAYTNNPENFVKENWKQLSGEFTGNSMHKPQLFELSQVIRQIREKNPKRKNDKYHCEELYKWYEEVHLDFLIETF